MTVTTNSLNNSATIWDVDNINLDANTISTTNTNGNLVLAPNGTGNIEPSNNIVPTGDRVQNIGSTTNSFNNIFANGLSFDDGTTTLSSYILHTDFTPALTFGGGSTGITYASRHGSYMRIGDVVIVFGRINLTSKGTSTGTALLTVPVAGNTDQQMIGGYYAFLTFGAEKEVIPAVLNSTVQLIGTVSGAAATVMTDTNFSNSTQINYSGAYMAG